jgi:hypothetical protein
MVTIRNHQSAAGKMAANIRRLVMTAFKITRLVPAISRACALGMVAQ